MAATKMRQAHVPEGRSPGSGSLIFLVLPLEKLGGVDIHEERALGEYRIRGHLDAAARELDFARLDALPASGRVAAKAFDEVAHFGPRIGGTAVTNKPAPAPPSSVG